MLYRLNAKRPGKVLIANKSVERFFEKHLNEIIFAQGVSSPGVNGLCYAGR